MFYTYIHYRKDDNQPFYIGKGQGKRYQSTAGRNKYWTNVANKHGWYSTITAEWHNEKDAYDHEILLIKCFNDLGYKLTNLSTGGEGANGPKTNEHKAAIKAYAQNRTPEHQAKLNAGAKIPRRKYKRNPLSDTAKASRVIQCRINAAARRGVELTTETKQKISESLTGKRWFHNGTVRQRFIPGHEPLGFIQGYNAHNVK